MNCRTWDRDLKIHKLAHSLSPDGKIYTIYALDSVQDFNKTLKIQQFISHKPRSTYSVYLFYKHYRIQ